MDQLLSMCLMEIKINMSKTVGHPELEWIDLGILVEVMYHFINILRVWNQVYLSRKKGNAFQKNILSATLGDRKKLFFWLLCLLFYSKEEHFTCAVAFILLSMLSIDLYSCVLPLSLLT